MNQAIKVIREVFGKEGEKTINYFESFHQRDHKMPLIINGRPGMGKTTLLNLISMAFSNGESTVLNYEYSTKAGMKKHIQESNMILIELDDSSVLTEERINDLMQLTNGKPLVITGNFTNQPVQHFKFITLTHENFSSENKALINKVLEKFYD